MIDGVCWRTLSHAFQSPVRLTHSALQESCLRALLELKLLALVLATVASIPSLLPRDSPAVKPIRCLMKVGVFQLQHADLSAPSSITLSHITLLSTSDHHEASTV